MEKRVRPAISGEDDDIELPPIPVGPDGGITPGFGIEEPEPPLPATPENFLCLRGPCRHYWFLKTSVVAGNPKGTWDALGVDRPMQHHHVCILNQGMETEFEDDNVFDCSRWEPLTKKELRQLKKRRRDYEKRHPEHKPCP